MKNAMKKLMAFALAAIMLIGALPFQASAAYADITVAVVGGDYGEDGSTRFTWSPSYEVGCSISALLSVFTEVDLETHQFTNARVWPVEGEKYDTTVDTTMIKPGESVRVRVEKIEDKGEDKGEEKETEGVEQEPTVEYINLRVNLDSADNTVFTEQVFPDNKESATIENLLKYYYSDYDADWQEDYDFSHAWSSVNQKNVGYYDEVYVGDTVSIRLNAEEVISDSNSNSNGNGTGNNVNDYFGDEALSPVWLYIYTNDNLNHPTKMINITNYTITDDTITKKEVMTVIDDYYKASNSNNGIIWKGMYMEYDDSNTSSLDIYQWVYGNIGDAVYGVNEARTKGTVIIMARVTGVTTVSSAAADNSNPKTGDQIFAPVAIMAVSACALAAVAFYLNKKRAM